MSGSQVHSLWLKEEAALLATQLTSLVNCLSELRPPFSSTLFLQSLLFGYCLSTSINSCDFSVLKPEFHDNVLSYNFTITLSPGIHNINNHVKEILYSDVTFILLCPRSSANQKLEVGMKMESQNHSLHFKDNTD